MGCDRWVAYKVAMALGQCLLSVPTLVGQSSQGWEGHPDFLSEPSPSGPLGTPQWSTDLVKEADALEYDAPRGMLRPGLLGLL